MVDTRRPAFGLDLIAPLPGGRHHRADRAVPMVFMGVRRDRAGLLLTTALQAAVLAVVVVVPVVVPGGQGHAQTMPPTMPSVKPTADGRQRDCGQGDDCHDWQHDAGSAGDPERDGELEQL
jgi:hypothetical protein